MALQFNLAQVPFLDSNGNISQPWLLFFQNQVNAVNAASGTRVYLETPAGVIDGVNKTFTLAHTPSPAGSAMGFIRQGGAGAFLPVIYLIDFTLAGAIITMTAAPDAGSDLRFNYVR